MTFWKILAFDAQFTDKCRVLRTVPTDFLSGSLVGQQETRLMLDGERRLIACFLAAAAGEAVALHGRSGPGTPRVQLAHGHRRGLDFPGDQTVLPYQGQSPENLVASMVARGR